MKKIALFITLLIVSFVFARQEIQHEAVAINIEVPVRVFDGNTFVDNLTIDDFEILEDGVAQSIEAVYLIKKTSIEREEKPGGEQVLTNPKVSRHFVLAFEVINWLPRISDTIDYFFNNVFQPGDSLVINTPIKSYQLSSKAIDSMSKENICAQFKSILREDVLKGNIEYKGLIRDLTYFEREVKYGQDRDLIDRLQREYFIKLRDYKYFDEEKLAKFADYLKNLEGQKHVFLFYQKEEIPYPKSLGSLGSFSLYSRDTSFDVDRIKRHFSDSTITTHFLFLTNKIESTIEVTNLMDGDRLPISDQSYQVFSAFNEVSKSTGGVLYVSANPFAAFKHASDASENYYLLYYIPKDYKPDGKFRNIKVKVKGKNYKVLHRAGYLAD